MAQVGEDIFPEIIRKLPEADIPIQGLHSYLFQGKDQQIVFMSFEEDAEVPEHSHEAQWGVVLDGEIELTMNSERFFLVRGDTYYIPKNRRHSARIKKGYKDLTLFDQEDRYRAREKDSNSL